MNKFEGQPCMLFGKMYTWELNEKKRWCLKKVELNMDDLASDEDVQAMLTEMFGAAPQ